MMINVKLSCLTLQENSGAKSEVESFTVFWSSLAASYPKLCDLVYSCKAVFFQLLHINVKYRNKLKVNYDLRCALTETKLRSLLIVCNITNTLSEMWMQVKNTRTWHECWEKKRWVCRHWWPWLWELIMTPCNISLQNYKIIRFVRCRLEGLMHF